MILMFFVAVDGPLSCKEIPTRGIILGEKTFYCRVQERSLLASLGFDGKADADKAARAVKALDSTKKSGSTERVSSR